LLSLTHSWKEKEDESVEATESIVRNLDDRYAAASSELDRDWQRPEKQQPYTKPSNTLLNLRVMLKSMLKARRFREVDVLGRLIEEREQRESAEAIVKMQHDFDVADGRLRVLSDVELNGIDGKAESLMSSLLRAKELDLRPYYQRLDNWIRIRDVQIANQKKISFLDPKSVSRQPAPMPAMTRVPAFVGNPKLTIPVFAPKRRPGSCTLPSQKRLIFRPKTAVVLAPMGTK
jgi:hypothetical protein